MNSRTRGVWKALAILAAALWLPLSAVAATDCEAADAAGVQRCTSGLDLAQVERMQLTQEKDQWCWAASIAMVFNHHGILVTQSDIVRRQFQGLDNRAISGFAITRILGSGWADRRGRVFLPTTLVSDKVAKRFQLGEATVVQELAQERPMILGAGTHAVVLVRVVYERSASGEHRIVGGTVIDPAPERGVRPLQIDELAPGYLAAVQVPGAQVGTTLADAGAAIRRQ